MRRMGGAKDIIGTTQVHLGGLPIREPGAFISAVINTVELTRGAQKGGSFEI